MAGFTRPFVSELDIDWIVEELRALPLQSAEYSHVSREPAWVSSYFRAMGNTLVGAVDVEHRAFILGAYGPTWFSAENTIHEMILWVPAEYRGRRVPVHLIRKFVDVCRGTAATRVYAGASLDISDNEKTLRLYELCGFTRKGSGVEKEL